MEDTAREHDWRNSAEEHYCPNCTRVHNALASHCNGMPKNGKMKAGCSECYRLKRENEELKKHIREKLFKGLKDR
jgi:hypothetical protein